MIIYEEDLGVAHVVYEPLSTRGSTGNKETYVGRPVYLQRHPNPMGKYYIIQVHFEGEMPKWIEKYALKEHAIVLKSENPLGFGLVQKESYLTISPLINQMIHDWFSSMDESMRDFKERLIENSKIVELNLKYYTEIFADMGLYYRQADIGQGAALSYKNFRTSEKFTLLDYEKQQDWERLIDELTFKREYPDYEENVDIEENLELELDDQPTENDEDSEENKVITIDEIYDESKDSDDVVIEEELITFSIDDIDVEFDEPVVSDDEEIIAEDIIEILIDEDNTEPFSVEHDNDESQNNLNDMKDEESNSDEIEGPVFEIKIGSIGPSDNGHDATSSLKVSSKKSSKDIIEGQLTLF